MADEGRRLKAVEQGLGGVTTGLQEVREHVGELRTEVGGLRTEVGELRTEVGELRTDVGGLRTEVGELRTDLGGLRLEVGELRTEVNTLRVLGEANADDIRKVAEVQVHHGHKLDEITRALEPLAELRAFIRVVIPDHERRLKALEGRS